jgi:dUTP pyrophosphatase
LKVRYEDGAFPLKREHKTDAGLDIRAMDDGVVMAKQSATFHTGIHIELPNDTMGDIRPKSGLMFNRDILTFGTVDEGYDGEIMIHMLNFGDEEFIVHRGDKIAQLAVVKVSYEYVIEVERINHGERGSAGFGSTGR